MSESSARPDEEVENVLKSSVESSVSVIEALTSRDSLTTNDKEKQSYSSQFEVSTNQSVSKRQSKNSLQKVVQDAENNIANDILASLVADVIGPLSADKKSRLIAKLKNGSVAVRFDSHFMRYIFR